VRIVEVRQIRHADTGIEIVGAGLQNVELPLRALGGDHRFKDRIEKRCPQRFQFAVQIRLVADGAGAVRGAFESAITQSR
jgi:hypothetical protein